MVYVLDKEGKPLMPTARHGKVRRLLRDEKAHVVRLQPFTIQLDYESTTYRQKVSLGIDAGSVHIGVSATTEKKDLFAAEVVLRMDIVKKLASRLELRRGRRFRKTRYRKPRFDNRRRKKDWLAPSVRNKVESHLKVIRLVHSLLPVTKTTIEVAQFDIQKIKNDAIQGVRYQQGEQIGFWNVREYVLARDGHKCQHCNGKSKDPVLSVHHLESRKTGGNAPSNLITLCETCHKAYHRGEFDLKVKRGTSLRDAAVMNIMRWAVYEQAKAEFENVHLTYGYVTKHTRIKNGIEKTHCADAFCISRNVKAVRSSSYFKCRSLPRHTRALHVCNPKKGGIRRSAVASHWIGKSRLQRFDSVEWNGVRCFIFGSTHGRLILRDIDGKSVTPTASVNAKEVTFNLRNNKIIMQELTYETRVITEEMLKKWLDVFFPSGYGCSNKDVDFTKRWFIGWLKVGGASMLDYPCEINLENDSATIAFHWWHNGDTEYSDKEVATYIMGVMAVLDPDLENRYRSDDGSLLLLEYRDEND